MAKRECKDCEECGEKLNAMKACRCGWIHPMALEDCFRECCSNYQMEPNDPRIDQATVKKTLEW